MKLRRNLSKLILVTLILSFFAGTALAGKEMTTIQGVVEKTDTGFIITTDDGAYATAGADLAAMVGKKIEATGKVAEGDAGKVINVLAIKEVKE